MVIYYSPHATFKEFNILVRDYEKEGPLICQLDMNVPISSALMKKYKQLFPWQFRDNHESWTQHRMNGPMGYLNRIRHHFHIDQCETLMQTSFANVLSSWNPPVDLHEKNKPCFLSARFVRRHGYLDMHVTYRAREILSRMVGNWDELIKLARQVGKKKGLELGNLYDFSYSAWTSDENRSKWGI